MSQPVDETFDPWKGHESNRLAEYRIYRGEKELIARDIVGDGKLGELLAVLKNFYPHDVLIVKEVSESIVNVIEPEGRRTD